MTTATRNTTAHKHMVRMASGRRLASYTLADPEVAVRMDALSTKLANSKEDSIRFLKNVGILNRSGRLSKDFGG